MEDKAQKNQKEQISPFTGRGKCLASHLLSSVDVENQMEEEGPQFITPGQAGGSSLHSPVPPAQQPCRTRGAIRIGFHRVTLSELCWKQLFGHQL